MTLAVLSWGYHETLRNTLQSYKDFGLDQLFSERVIFFQEYSKLDKAIAQEFGYESFGSPENIGIAEAYKLLAAYASGEFFLFLENDWKLIESPVDAILGGMALLSLGIADVVRYRHSENPGAPLWTRQFQGREYDRPTHLLDAIHWEKDMNKFPEIEEVLVDDKSWFVTTSKNANWTNNPHMIKPEFAQNVIAPRTGDDDIEKQMQAWWENQNYKVAQGRGLFTHERTN